jgi:hypothetical protein
MKIADLTTGSAKLSAAYKALRLRWDATKDHWQDANCRRFEETYIDPLEPEIRDALEAISNLHELLSRAERECQ